MKKVFVIILWLLNLADLNAQNQNNVNLPTSPEVAMFKRYGDIPVGTYTGVAQTNVPIYTIREGGFELPINLNYNASGIKLDDQATWVGLGWNLMPEGVIYQDVKGKADQNDVSYATPNEYIPFYNRLELYPGGTGRFKVVKQKGFVDYDWCTIGNQQNPGCFPPSSPSGSDGSTVVNDIVYRKNAEVDIFRFNFFGHTGSFFINLQTREIIQLEKSENIKFEVFNDQIIATDDNGIKYYFGYKEIFSSYNGTSLSEEFSSRSYKISTIVFPNTKQIAFEYQDANYNFYSFSQQRNIRTSAYSLGPTDMCYGKINYQFEPAQATLNNSNVKILQKIKTDDLEIIFNLGDRQDINLYSWNNLKRLESIDFINRRNNKKIKSLDFIYTYFPYQEDFPSAITELQNFTQMKDAFGKRLKLDKVSFFTYDNMGNKINNNEEFKFDYDLSVTLPSKVSFAKDFWGYYNGHYNNNLLPDLSFYLTPAMGVPVSYEGNNRYSNKDFVSSYMLKRIEYPTKGYTDYEYELNSFKNQFIPSHDQIFNLSETIHLNNNGIGGYSPLNNIYDFPYDKGVSLNFHAEFSGGFDGGPTGPQSKRYNYYQMTNANASIKLLKIKKNAGGGETVLEVIKEWKFGELTNNADFSQNYNFQMDGVFNFINYNDPTIQNRVVLNIDNNMYQAADIYHSAGIRVSFTIVKKPDIDSNFTSYGHGPRIKSLKNYSSQGTLAEWKQYEYESGVLQNTISPLRQKDYYCFSCGQATNCSDSYSYNSFWSITDQISSGEYDAVGYAKVTESTVNVNNPLQIKGKTEYHYWNTENTVADYFPVIKNQHNGLLQQKVTRNEDNNVIESVTYKYKNLLPFNQFYSVRAEKKFLLSGKDPMIASTGEYDGIAKYHFYTTPMMAESHKIDSIMTQRYFGNKIIESKEHFTYNTLGSVEKHEAINPDQTIITSYKYSEGGNNPYLFSKGITGIPLETEVKKNSNIISKIKTQYPLSQADADLKTSSLPIPYEVLNKNLYSDDMEKMVVYNQYDSKGNLQQYTAKNGVSTVIVWGYNQTQPIAKIEGAKLADIQQSLIDSIVTASNTDASAAPNNDETAFLSALNTFRANTGLSGYQITTYTYDPLVGVRSITPPSGISEFYIYDPSNRLKEIRQQEKDSSGNMIYKTLKEFKYNYKN
ncbi:hypothetical protein [Chryseobacterium sp. 2VB]|uniref:hypothetical protein n=1 Tax=Chryseobacterium sp. 2VB TaxID=2502204 RepID=UPI0010F8CDCF|nr:hypothetical protein [Chryseobacterium sp. 2VB]